MRSTPGEAAIERVRLMERMLRSRPMPFFEFRVANNTSNATAFYLEPWGGKYIIRSHGALRVVIEAPICPVLEWELAEDVHSLVVHEPAGALATVYDGDAEVRAE
jgi:hypothetical protein